MALLIKASGEVVKDIAPKNGTDYSLAELKGFIGGGYIEIVPVCGLIEGQNTAFWMVIDEEGRLKDFPHNPQASLIAGTDICGDAFICLKSEIK